jgi:hypothetical protein
MNSITHAPNVPTAPATTIQELPSADTVAPASPAQLTLARPPAPVTCCNTAVQTQPPQNGAGFEQQYGRKAKFQDLEHKVGLAAMGRYRDPSHDPLGVVVGAPFWAPLRVRASKNSDTGSQTMDFPVINMALTRAKVKASMAVKKYQSVAREAGYNIWAECKDDRVVHSEHVPFAIMLDKEGNAPRNNHITGRCMPNVYKEGIMHESMSNTTLISPDITSTLQLPAKLRASRNAATRSIAVLEPSLRDDWTTAELEKVTVDDTDLDVDRLAYASQSDAFVVFDADHHVTREPVRIRLATSAQSRKRKEHATDHIDEGQRDLKRSRIPQPPRSLLPSGRQSTFDSFSLVEEPVSCLDHLPSHTLHTVEAHSAFDNIDTYRKPREDNEKPSRAADSPRKDHHRARGSSRYPSHDEIQTPYMDSSPRSRHSARAKRDRSILALDSGAEADTTSRLDRKPGVSRRRATNMKDHTEQMINSKSMKTSQATPEHYPQLEDDTDRQGSRTSSSTPISHSTFATSYGSNESRTSHRTDDDPSKRSSSPAHIHTDDDALKTGSPQPSERHRQAEIKPFVPRVQEPRNTRGMAQTTDRKNDLEAKAYIVASQHQEWSLASKPADGSHGGRKRSLDEILPSTFATLAEQKRSKRSKGHIRKPEGSRSEHNLAPSKGTEEIESKGNVKITPEQLAESPVVLEQSEKDMVTSETDIIKSQGKQTGKAELRSKTAGVVNGLKNEMDEESAKTEKVEEKMTETQKKIAARRAERSMRPAMGIYVPPLGRRTNAAGNATALSQNRTNNNRNSRRKDRI